MKPVGWVLLAIGAAVLIVGVVLGTSSVHRSGASCGSGFGGVSQDAIVQDYTNALEGTLSDVSAACRSAVSDRKTFALAATIPGAVLVLAGAGALIAGWDRDRSASLWRG